MKFHILFFTLFVLSAIFILIILYLGLVSNFNTSNKHQTVATASPIVTIDQQTDNSARKSFSSPPPGVSYEIFKYDPETASHYSESDFSGSYLGKLIAGGRQEFISNYVLVNTEYFSFLVDPIIIKRSMLETNPKNYVFDSTELSNTLFYINAEAEIRVSKSDFDKVVFYETKLNNPRGEKVLKSEKDVVAFGEKAVELTFQVKDEKGLLHVLIVPIKDKVYVFSAIDFTYEASSDDYMIGSVILNTD